MPILRRLLSAVVDVRPEERSTVVLMFLYSFLAMTAYNIVQPVTRSAVITDLGADNIPYVLLAAGLVISLLMQLYGRIEAWLPRRWALSLLQLGLTGILLVFWAGFRTNAAWVSAAFYLYGMMLGTLLLSQFWTLANELYDPRQARRIFGFIGGGASLGGMTGAGLAALAAETTGTDGLLLLSAASLVATAGVVAAILPRATTGDTPTERDNESPVGLAEAWRLLRGSPNLRQISILIGLAALGAVLIDQQLNMAAEQFREDEDAITQFLASVRFLLSAAALVIQVVFVNRIYRLLGIGFALLTLPVSFAATAALILLTGALWAPAVASVVDRSIRYTVDRTTREIFFLPLPSRIKRRAKPFIDVTVDRLARGGGGVLVLVLIKPWGLELAWHQLSIVSLALVVGWLVVAGRARRRYVAAVRKGLEQGDVEAADVRVSVPDLTTVEALFEELGHPDERRVLYAIDLLESLDKRHLVTPLLLHHASAAVRARALAALGSGEPAVVSRWEAQIYRLVDDPSPEVRAQAMVTLAGVRHEDAAVLARRFMDESSPRMAASAAVVLASTGDPRDAATDTRPGAAAVRRDVAIAIRQVNDTRTRQLLVPLLQDSYVSVAEEAMRSVGGLRPLEPLFIPTLISLLGNRRLKSGARDALVQYGEPALDLLAYALRDPGEDLWVRRHLPATVAHIPCQRAMDVLVSALDDDDRFLRFKAVAAMTDLRRDAATDLCGGLRPDSRGSRTRS